MRSDKKKLNVIQEGREAIAKNTTCFATHDKHNVDCQRSQCPYWVQHGDVNNCIIIASKEGPHTLQKIGEIYGLTRMRICQMEKTIFAKIKKIS